MDYGVTENQSRVISHVSGVYVRGGAVVKSDEGIGTVVNMES